MWEAILGSDKKPEDQAPQTTTPSPPNNMSRAGIRTQIADLGKQLLNVGKEVKGQQMQMVEHGFSAYNCPYCGKMMDYKGPKNPHWRENGEKLEKGVRRGKMVGGEWEWAKEGEAEVEEEEKKGERL